MDDGVSIDGNLEAFFDELHSLREQAMFLERHMPPPKVHTVRDTDKPPQAPMTLEELEAEGIL